MVVIKDVEEFWGEFRISGEPTYNSEGFTLEIHHGGDFVKVVADEHIYEEGEVCWVELLDPDKISWIEINTFAWRLGYRKPPVHYWFRPLDMATFLPITKDEQVQQMMRLLPSSRIMQIYCIGGGQRQVKLAEMEHKDPKHEDNIPHVEFIPEIVLKPIKAHVGNGCRVEENAVGKRKTRDIYEGEEINEDDDEEYVNSDYEILLGDEGYGDDGQDDLEYEENVDNHDVYDEHADMGFDGEISDHSHDSEELGDLIIESESDDDEVESTSKCKRKKRHRVTGKTWVPERDMKDPQFEINQQFANSAQFKAAVKKYAVKTGYNLCFKKNAGVKVEVACGKKHKGKRETWPCQFWISASVIKGKEPEMIIKSINLNHKNCETVSRVKFCTSTFLAEEYVQLWKADPYMSRKLFQGVVCKHFGQNISHKQVVRARKLAAIMNSGDEADQYNLLETYVEVLRQSNPGSTIDLVTEMDGDDRKFKRFYVCFDACKRGWMTSCRLVVGLDGCHIKTKYPGQLLSAVGIDANNGMFPIAYAVVEIENYETWYWFLQHLIEDLNMQNEFKYVFMSDKQKGILNAVEDLMPNSEHRHCVRHLHNNFKVKNSGIVLKNLLWSAARDTTKTWFDKHWEEITAVSTAAINWLNKHENPKHWSRSHFREESKCDMLLNNLCESFNAAILECRDKPMLVMLEMLRQNMMVRMNNRRVAGMKWKSEIGPRVQKIIEKNIKRSREYNNFRSSDYVFEVQGKKGSVLQSQHTVDLAKHSCTCRRWTVSGLPCPHAIQCIFTRGEDPKQYVHRYYKKQAYLDAYSHAINPVSGIEYWTIREAKIHPPQCKRQPGRPKKARRKEEAEPPAPEATKVCGSTTRLSRSKYVTITCSVCDQPNHNSRTCVVEKARKKKEAEDLRANGNNENGHCSNGKSDNQDNTNAKEGRAQQVAKTTPRRGQISEPPSRAAQVKLNQSSSSDQCFTTN